VLSRVFRGKFREGLKVAFQQRKLVFCGGLEYLSDASQFRRFLDQLRPKDWVVYAKPPFGGPEHVLHYLARYTHRIAISNHRLLSFDGKEVTFRWKDYAHGNKKRKMTLAADEFLRRFLLHVLPGGFVRIRHFGFLANRRRTSSIALCRKLIGEEQVLPLVVEATKLPAKTTWPCPRCSNTMLVVERLSAAQALRYLKTAVSIDSS
jgi:hypothetical protein